MPSVSFIIEVGGKERVIPEASFLFLVEVAVLYEGFNAMAERVQAVLPASVSGITDKHVRVSAVQGMEVFHVQGIGRGITGTRMDGIVQDKLPGGIDPFRASSICPSAFSTFSGVIS